MCRFFYYYLTIVFSYNKKNIYTFVVRFQNRVCLKAACAEPGS